MNTGIDTTASLSARKTIVIEAPIDVVWNVQTDIEAWPQWQPDISAATLDGALTAGSIFRWKAKGLKIVSTLHTVEPQRQIGWTGDSLGMFAIHNWTFEAEDLGTRVITEESLSGWLVRLLKIFDPQFLDKSLEASLQTLKAQAESSSNRTDTDRNERSS